ncbi:protein hunchback [Cephus cinctus]|uniref:Protein hunchback n=1 Tax=Cephus cinctus TaxID=211228 RepID=A0AAJ7FRS5_CEPCN|nr:protein hunchback [Cephus cinctus]
MLKHILICIVLCQLVLAEPPVHGIRPSNVLGGPEQHASFSFVRPGLTQTSYAFNGPSSHQAFSSSIGNPHLAQRVLPNVAHALAYRNPGLGYIPAGPVGTTYAAAPATAPVAGSYQAPYDQASALAYLQQIQQLQQYQQQQQNPAAAAYQAQLAQLFAFRQNQAAANQIPEQVQLQQQQHEQQQQQQQQNLLGIAYSAAPSVAHVKVNGNGYKFDF